MLLKAQYSLDVLSSIVKCQVCGRVMAAHGAPRQYRETQRRNTTPAKWSALLLCPEAPFHSSDLFSVDYNHQVVSCMDGDECEGPWT